MLNKNEGKGYGDPKLTPGRREKLRACALTH